MFTVKIKKEKYQVDFTHCRGKDAIFFIGHEGTFCQILDHIGMTVATSITKLHNSDNYCKNFGRKLSLARALKNGGFSKSDRKLFWQEYFRVRGKVD
jgi:hypothetical protein